MLDSSWGGLDLQGHFNIETSVSLKVSLPSVAVTVPVRLRELRDQDSTHALARDAVARIEEHYNRAGGRTHTCLPACLRARAPTCPGSKHTRA